MAGLGARYGEKNIKGQCLKAPLASLTLWLLCLAHLPMAFAGVNTRPVPAAPPAKLSTDTPINKAANAATIIPMPSDGATVRPVWADTFEECDVLEARSSNSAGRTRPAARLDAALVAKARSGDGPAAWRAGLASFRGACRASNYGEAMAFFEMAAKAGIACASGAQGVMLSRGWGASRELSNAQQLIQQSMDSGCNRAYYWAWLVDDQAIKPDARARGLQRLMLGVQAGEGHALNAWGVLREADAQREAARSLYQQAAKAGNATAQLNISRLVRYFAQSSEKPDLAALGKRAQRGEAQAQYLLARRFHQGDSAAVNYVLALQWYELSARQGFAASREMLGLIQARLAGKDPTSANAAAVFQDLAMVDIASDELNKKRGASQPIEDTDPFAGL